MKLERRPLIPRAELRRGTSECVAQGRELLGWLVDPHGAVHTRQAPEDRKDFEPECCPIRHTGDGVCGSRATAKVSHTSMAIPDPSKRTTAARSTGRVTGPVANATMRFSASRPTRSSVR